MIPEPSPGGNEDDDDDDHDDEDEVPPPTRFGPGSRSSSLSCLRIHNCLVNILEFLSFLDMNNFSLVSKECYNVRCHKSLNQTRSGTIRLGSGNGGVQSIVELMLKVRKQKWHKTFRGNRTHLHLMGLNCLSSDIESIDEEFINKCYPLKHVTSLDCSIHNNDEEKDESSSSSWLFRYEDYINKGFAHGLALSLLVPNLRKIDMSYLPLTSLGVAWIAENNPKLERIHWNRSLIWPINHHTYDILRACRNLKELHIDDARLLFGPSRSRRRRARHRQRRLQQQQQQEGQDQDDIGNEHNNGNNDADGINHINNGNDIDIDNDDDNIVEDEFDSEALWSSLIENIQSLVRVSCRRARWYNEKSKFTFIGETEEGQEALKRFVRSAPNLRWFRSDLTNENLKILKKERQNIVFC
jgi:hypothetical protein